ncbi:MAG: hypothetical protein U0359_09425 [Byssovorax sp.]
MGLLDDGEELVGVELLGGVEAGTHDAIGGVVAAGDDVEEVADTDDITDLEVFDMLDEELGEEAHGRALALEGAGEGDQGIHQDGAEGIEAAELFFVEVAEEGLPGGVAEAGPHGAKGVVEGFSIVVLGAQDALFGDGGEVAVFEADGVEAAFGPLEGVADEGVLESFVVAADHFSQVALAGDEADERDVAVGLLGLDELDELLDFVVKKREVRGAGGEPEDEFVEEEDDAGITEPFGVAGEDGEAVVEVDELAAVVGKGAEAGPDEGVEEVFPEARVGGGGGILEAGHRPALGRADLAPGRVVGRAGVHGGKEAVFAELGEHAAGVVEELFVGEDAGEAGVGVELADSIEVAAEDGAFEVAGVADEVKSELEEAGLAGKGVLLAEAVEVGDAPGMLAAFEEEGEQGHEVGLAAAEAAMKEGGAAAAVAEGRGREVEGAVEGEGERRGDDVGAGRDLGVLDSAAELLDEADLVDALGEVEEVFDALSAHEARFLS